MSLRDWFAGLALAGIHASVYGGEPDIEKIAKYSYEQADAMLEARKGAKQ